MIRNNLLVQYRRFYAISAGSCDSFKYQSKNMISNMFPIAIIFSDLATRILNRHNACNVSVVTVKSVYKKKNI